MKINYRWLAAGAMVLVLIVAAIIGGRLLSREPEDASVVHMQETGVLRVGMDAAYPPFEWIDESNQLVGLDVDIANEMGRRMGVQIEFSNIAYDGLYDALYTRKVDVLISGLVNAREFWGKAAFSVPYFNMGEHLVVAAGAEQQTIEALAGKTIAVEVGSGGDVEARKWQRRLADLNVARYPDANAALAAVQAGDADAALVDGVTARLGVGQHPDLVMQDSVVDTPVAVAAHPESLQMLDLINHAMIEMDEDGTMDALIDKWFGPQK